MNYVAIIALAACASTASAQIFATEREERRRGQWGVDAAAQFLDPVGEFRDNITQAWGFGVALKHHIARSPLAVRADMSLANYGSERKRVPLSPSLNRVMVDMRTRNNIAVFSLGPELRLGAGPVQPYVFGFAGISYFYTESTADDVDGGSFASSTNFDDAGFARGAGAGLSFPLKTRRVDIAIDGGARYTRNGERTYLRRGDIIDQPDGSLAFTPRTTEADYWQYHLGISIRGRGR